MDFAQKMFLVPQHQMDKLKESTPSIRKTVENDVDTAIRHILARTDIDPHEKIKLYTVALQRFLALVKQGDQETNRLTLTLPQPPNSEQETSGDDVSNPNSRDTSGGPTATITRTTRKPTGAAAASFSDDDVVDDDDGDEVKSDVFKNVPLRSKKNASFIWEKMSRDGSVTSWNDKGEFIFNGKTVHGSHVADLIRNVTAPYNVSDDRRPPGWSSFLHAMAVLNIPYSAIPNNSVRRKIGSVKGHAYATILTSPPSPFSPRAFQTLQSSKWAKY